MSRLEEIWTFRSTYLSYFAKIMASEDIRNTLGSIEHVGSVPLVSHSDCCSLQGSLCLICAID